MKTVTTWIIGLAIILGFTACGTIEVQPSKVAIPIEKPSAADLMAFKVYHHMVYMETTAKQAGGTNKLHHTTKLPTEGTDPVVSPALDHIYTKAVIDLTEGPVIIDLPKVEKSRYFSIQIADEEHYTIYDEIQPEGKYVIVRKGKNMKVPEGATVIESPGDYPHLFIRAQVKTPTDLPNVFAIQQKIKLTGVSKELTIKNPVKFTLETQDVYPQNRALLESAIDFNKEDYIRVSQYIGAVAPKFSVSGNTGMFGPIDSDEPHSNDPEYRAAAIVGHLGFPIHHAYYSPYFTNCKDEVLNGDKSEVFVFPYKPEGVELFWSVTRYSALTRNTLAGKNDLFNAYNTKPDANGNITVTFSVEDPKDGTYWMPVNKGEPYYLIVRYYKPDVVKLPSKPCKPVEAIVSLSTPASGVIMNEEYVKTIGRMAYVWGWPIVNSHNRRAGITQAPAPGKLGGVVPVAPRGHLSMLFDYVEPNQSFVACPNQDVVYGTVFASLDKEPVVIQVPDFADRFWVYALYDARTDQYGEMGKAYGTKPGFYLLAGPNWKGKIPKGIKKVFRSSTEFSFVGPRIFLNDTKEDREAIKLIVNQINAYPLSKFDGKMKTMDWTSTPVFPAPKVEGENKWVVPEKFFEQLPAILDLVDPLPGEEALYASMRQVLEAAKRDPNVKKTLVETAIATEKEVIAPLMLWKHNGVPAGQGWNRSVNNANWGHDYLMRTACAKSNMFENRSNETQYYYSDNDTKGELLKGDSIYAVTFAKGQLPPVNGFWSLTVYNKHHLFEVNDQNKYALGTKNRDLKYNEDGSLTLYVGPKAPSAQTASNWLETPKDSFSLYIRAYWAKKAILDGSWVPPIIERVENK